MRRATQQTACRVDGQLRRKDWPTNTLCAANYTLEKASSTASRICCSSAPGAGSSRLASFTCKWTLQARPHNAQMDAPFHLAAMAPSNPPHAGLTSLIGGMLPQSGDEVEGASASYCTSGALCPLCLRLEKKRSINCRPPRPWGNKWLVAPSLGFRPALPASLK